MNIIEAVKSGKRFRRKNRSGYYGWIRCVGPDFKSESCPGESVDYQIEDILADDWEIEEEKIELSWSGIEKAFRSARDQSLFIENMIVTIKKELGFKDE